MSVEVRTTAFLKTIKAIHVSELKKEEKPEGLSERARKALIITSSEPGITLGSLYKRLSLHGEQGTQVFKELSAHAMVKQHSLPRVGKGNAPKTWEVLKPGIEFLSSLGLRPEKKFLKGGFLHYVMALWLKDFFENKKRSIKFEFTMLGKKTFDGAHQLENGEWLGIEIALSGTIDHNLKEALRGASVSGVKRVCMGFNTESKCKKFDQALNKLPAENRSKEKIRSFHLGKLAPFNEREYELPFFS